MDYRKQFPQLEEKPYGKPLVYLDNAATSLRPECVVRAWEENAFRKNANIHRAVHHFSAVATEAFEKTRADVASFIGAGPTDQIVFTSGTTQAINLLSSTYGDVAVGEGDNVVVGEEEHHSNIVPWQMLCRRKGAQLRVLPVGEDGSINPQELDNLIDKRTRLVSVAHVSNVLGLVNPISEMAERCHSRGVPLLVDGAQGIVHEKVDVGALGCDFYVFSGHKIYAAPGTGVLYARKGLMEDLPPYMGGGEMIASVGWEKTEYESAPRRFEAGTQNFTSVPTLSPALDLAVRMGRGDLDRITGYMLEALGRREKIRLYGKPSPAARKVPLFSITVDGVHHEDIALILDKMGIAVRSGQMCAEPLMHRFGVEGMLRASFAPYNTLEEAQYFIESLDRAVEMLSR